MSDKINIGITLFPLWPGKNGGIEVYTHSLLEYILRIDEKNNYFLFTYEWNDDAINYTFGNFRKIKVGNATHHQRWRKLKFLNKLFPTRLVTYMQDLDIDLFFAPMMAFEVARFGMPGIVTIPDIQHEYYPSFFSTEELRQRELLWKRSCFKAAKIIAISEYTKKTLMEKYKIEDKKIQVIYGAVGDEFYSFAKCPPIEAVREKYNLPDLYAYYPANTWRHKNHDLLIMAFALFKKRYSHPLKLVFTGFNPDNSNRISKLISHYGLSDEVVNLGYVDRYELPRLYQGASFLVFPSLYEGFGIPLLEAMAMGCPVMASEATSIPEIVGDAALLFDPRKPDEIAESMNRILTDKGLRKALTVKGKERAQAFSWEKTARETIQLFESTIHGKK